MRAAVLAVLALLIVVGSSGCRLLNCRGCQAPGPYTCADGTECDMRGRGACAGDAAHRPARGALEAIRGCFHHQPLPPEGGPPVGTVAYPYYTVRGPRDFLANNPSTIGR